MIKTLKLNFTVPADVADELKNRVSKSHRSAFVSEAIQKKLEELKKKDLEKELAEGYKARRDESL